MIARVHEGPTNQKAHRPGGVAAPWLRALVVLASIPWVVACAGASPSASPSALPVDGVPRVGAKALHRAIRAGKRIVVVDLRDEAAYLRGHIPGARHLSEAALLEGSAALPQDAEVVLLCDCLHESLAVDVAWALRRQGQLKVHAYQGRAKDWPGALEQGPEAPPLL